MTNEAASILFLSIFTLLGAAMVWGAHRRWRWLVDPPTKLWPFYSQAAIKKLFGTSAVVYFTYFVGTGMIVITALLMAKALGG